VSLAPFDSVVTEHAPTVLRVCRALLPHHEAEDAAAETFLAALEAYPRLPPDSNIRGWLVTIAHRKALDALRRKRRQPIPAAELPDRSHQVTHEPTDERLWAAERALAPKQRQAVAYRYVADLSYAEIAGLLGISEAAARRNAADGIKSLRRTYSPELETTS
jgi:RNA polymerase sigma factor (sigma-70 family)